VIEEARCPNCGTSLHGGETNCAKCGFVRKIVHFANDTSEKELLASRPLPLRAWWILSLLFIVPLGACGGCWAFGFSIDNSNDGFINQAFYVEVVSIAIGLVMLLVNIVVSVWRQK